MKKACVALMVLLLCAGAALPVFARGVRKEKPQPAQNVYVQTPRHRQYVGGNTGVHSQKGLDNARAHSGRLQAGKPGGSEPKG